MSNSLRSFGMISTSIWQSEKFTKLKSRESQLAYLWLHSSAKTCSGVLRAGPAHLFEECNFVDSLELGNEIFLELHSVEMINHMRPYAVITDYLRFNPVKSFRHAIGAFKEVLALPDCEAKAELFMELQKHKGSRDLVAWRDKDGNCHDILVEIMTYLETISDGFEHVEPFASPLQCPSEGVGNPSGKIKNTKKKEKSLTVRDPMTQGAVVTTRPVQSDREERPMLASEAAKQSELVKRFN